MKTILAAALAFSFTLAFAANTAFAQVPPDSIKEDESVIKEVPENLQDSFSFDVHYQGMSNQTGLGIAVESPFAWDVLALRLGISGDRLHVPKAAGDDFNFTTAQAALKFQGDLRSTAHIYPYVLLAFDFFLTNHESTGSKSAVGAFIGADWQYVSTPAFARGIRIVRSFFIEAGSMDSNFTPTNNGTAMSVSDGFMTRIGFRRYF